MIDLESTQSPQFGKLKVRVIVQTPLKVVLLKSAVNLAVEPLPFS